MAWITRRPTLLEFFVFIITDHFKSNKPYAGLRAAGLDGSNRGPTDKMLIFGVWHKVPTVPLEEVLICGVWRGVPTDLLDVYFWKSTRNVIHLLVLDLFIQLKPCVLCAIDNILVIYFCSVSCSRASFRYSYPSLVSSAMPPLSSFCRGVVWMQPRTKHAIVISVYCGNHCEHCDNVITIYLTNCWEIALHSSPMD